VRRALPVLLLITVLTGCGYQRTAVPDVRHADAPAGTREVDLEAAGVAFTAPRNWADLGAQGPRVGGIQSKTATLAIWRYPRTEPLPRTSEELRAAMVRLEDRVRERDATFRLRDSTVTRRGGADAIELLGRATIAGLPFGVRSTHVFKGGYEVVLDAYAPPERFDRLDADVFQPLLRSLEVRTP
jgi:hypothetical protein